MSDVRSPGRHPYVIAHQAATAAIRALATALAGLAPK